MIQPEVQNLHFFIGFLCIFTGEQGEFLLLYNACTQEMLNVNETGCKYLSVLRGSRINSSPCQQWDTLSPLVKNMWLHSRITSSQMAHIFHEWISYTWCLSKSRIPVILIWWEFWIYDMNLLSSCKHPDTTLVPCNQKTLQRYTWWR